MSIVRAKNMELRRQRILLAARDIIAENGVDGLTTRGLAEAAGMTVPTLYNLIGSKDDIIRAMVVKSVEDFKTRLKFSATESAPDMIEAFIEAATDPDAEGEEYWRAIIVASDRIAGVFSVQGDSELQVSEAGQLSVDVAANVCRAAIAQGVLRGNIPADEIAEQLFASYRGPRRDWAYRLISLEEARRRIRRGFYLILAADAAPDFREVLLGKIELSHAPHMPCAA